MIYRQKLSKIGNSIGLTLPQKLRDQLKFKLGQEVYVQEDTVNKSIIISSEPVSESQKPVDYDFYSRLEKVTQKYSKALKQLADK